MSKQIRKSAHDRKIEIADTAIRLAGEIGPDRLTVQHLADAIGLSQPAIFRHFPTKGAIWQAVAERIAELMKAATIKTLQPGLRPAEQLRALVIAQLAFVQSTPAIPAILFSRELHAENDDLRVFFAGLMAGRQRAFAKLIAGEIDTGAFRADLNPDDAALLILAFIQGLAMCWSLNARAFDLVGEGERLLEIQFQAFRSR